MSLTKIVKDALNTRFVTEDGDSVRLELIPPISEVELATV